MSKLGGANCETDENCPLGLFCEGNKCVENESKRDKIKKEQHKRQQGSRTKLRAFEEAAEAAKKGEYLNKEQLEVEPEKKLDASVPEPEYVAIPARSTTSTSLADSTDKKPAVLGSLGRDISGEYQAVIVPYLTGLIGELEEITTKAEFDTFKERHNSNPPQWLKNLVKEPHKIEDNNYCNLFQSDPSDEKPAEINILCTRFNEVLSSKKLLAGGKRKRRNSQKKKKKKSNRKKRKSKASRKKKRN